MTSFIGGISVSVGAEAMVRAGALAVPVGFPILLLGKSERLTKHCFLPVTAVLERRGTPHQLAALRDTSLVANLVGALLFAFLIWRSSPTG